MHLSDYYTTEHYLRIKNVKRELDGNLPFSDRSVEILQNLFNEIHQISIQAQLTVTEPGIQDYFFRELQLTMSRNLEKLIDLRGSRTKKQDIYDTCKSEFRKDLSNFLSRYQKLSLNP